MTDSNYYDIERAILCSLLLDQEKYYLICEEINESMFLIPKHRKLWVKIEKIIQENQPVDPLILKDDYLDFDFLNGILKELPTSQNIYYYAQILKELYMKRKLNLLGRRICQISRNEHKSDEIIEEINRNLVFIISNKKSESEHIKPLLKETILNLSSPTNNKISTGYRKLDNITKGFQNGHLIIVAARPSMGKSTLCINMASKIAEDKNVLFISLEMTSDQLSKTILSMSAEVDLNNENLSEKEMARILSITEKLKNLKLWINDNISSNITKIAAIIKMMKVQYKIDIIFIDYLQLINAGRNTRNNYTRNEEVAYISKILKTLAKELNIPVVCLSQLNRLVESRGDKRPVLSDLRDSGSIEQDADIVLLLFRESMYNKDKKSDIEETEVIIAKNRFGMTGMKKLLFYRRFRKFEE